MMTALASRRFDLDLLTPVVAFLVAAGALEVAAHGQGFSLFWPVNALILGLALMAPSQARVAMRIGSGNAAALAANLLLTPEPMLSIVFMLCNLTQCALIAYALYPIAPRLIRRLELPGDALWRFLAVPLGCAGSATIAATAVREAHGGVWIEIAANWFLADFLGLVTVLPLILMRDCRDHRASAPRRLFALLATAVALALCLLSIRTGSWLYWAMTFPLGAAIAFYGGINPASLFIMAMLALSMIAVAFDSFGEALLTAPARPLPAPLTGEILLDLQIIVAMIASATLLVAAAVRNEAAARDAMRRALEETQAEATMNRRLIGALDRLQDGFVMYDSEDRLLLCNARFRELYAESAPAIRPGRKFEEILRYGLQRGQYPEAIGCEEAWLQERLRLHSAHLSELEQKLPNGRWLFVRESRTADGGRIGFRMDITERKALEARLLAALEDAEKANLAKDAFLTNMNHELRTPLNAVIGFAQLIAHLAPEHGRAETVRDYARDIESAGRHLLAMIEDLLSLSRNGHAPALDVAPHDSTRIMEQALRMTADIAKSAGKRLVIERGGPAPVVQADQRRLTQILVNLITNAIKYSGDAERVTLSVRVEGARAVFEVADEGPGVPEADRARIFERFERLDAPRRGLEGAGIGLAISRELAEAMQGAMGVSTTPGGGATFWLALPAVPAAARPGSIAKSA